MRGKKKPLDPAVKHWSCNSAEAHHVIFIAAVMQLFNDIIKNTMLRIWKIKVQVTHNLWKVWNCAWISLQTQTSQTHTQFCIINI